jgi:hypothetical protein
MDGLAPMQTKVEDLRRHARDEAPELIGRIQTGVLQAMQKDTSTWEEAIKGVVETVVDQFVDLVTQRGTNDTKLEPSPEAS